MKLAIIVTYSPDWSHVNSMVDELLAANLTIIIFDNTPRGNFKINRTKVYLLRTGDNIGLGGAFNYAIKYAKSELDAVSDVIFFDQDSTFAYKDICGLFNELSYLKSLNVPVGVLGAKAIMPSGSSYPFKIVNDTHALEGFEQAWFVMSSFSIIPMEVLNNIGLFREELFIDLIDSEFSFRCRKHNLLNLISNNIKFDHVVGET